MKHLMSAGIILGSLIFSIPAQATDAYTSARVYLRAGPDGGYPVVELLERGEKLDLVGCLSSREWCEVRTHDKERGWVYASYLEGASKGGRVTFITNYGNRVNIVVFEPVYYWDSHYRNKDFYKDRDRWLPKNKKRNYGRHDRHDGGGDGKPDDTPSMPEKYNPAGKALSNHKYNPNCSIFNPDC